MQTPTTSQLRTAIEVLKKLEERLNYEAAHTVMQLPETRLGDNYAARVEARAIERTTVVETVGAQLETWRDELLQKRKHAVTNHV